MKLKFKIKIPFMEFLMGQSIEIDVNSNGVPKDRFWRNRLRDSQVDGCIELIKDADVQPKSKSKQESVANVDITS